MPEQILRDGKELEDALTAVNPKEFLKIVDHVRSSPERLNEFFTLVATNYPIIMGKIYESMTHGGLNLKDIDDLLHQHKRIEAIKLVRLDKGIGLKEAKELIDKRNAELGYSVPTYPPGTP